MKRISALLALSFLVALPLGCGKKDKTKNPDEATEKEGQGDPMAELKSIPDQIQAEVDNVMQPITDVDVVVDQVTTMPDRLGLDKKALMGMAKASLDNGTVAVSVELPTAEAKAEVEALLNTVKGIGIGIKEMPERSAQATKNILALGAKATALVAKLQASYSAKLKSPFAKAEEKAKLQADLDAILKIDADIKGMVGEAKSTVTSLPSKGTEAMAKLTAAFAT